MTEVFEMKAVFEEINGDYAVFIVEELKKSYHLDKADLPKNTVNGDIFEVEIGSKDELKLLERLSKETKSRKASAQSKRELLLKRNSKK